jgi:hypothetical protein
LPQLIASCGFVGAWLLVFGPLDQAILKLEDDEFERDSITRDKREIEVPPRVSAWLLTVLPGCGPIIAAKLPAEIGPLARFTTDAQLARHSGAPLLVRVVFNEPRLDRGATLAPQSVLHSAFEGAGPRRASQAQRALLF